MRYTQVPGRKFTVSFTYSAHGGRVTGTSTPMLGNKARDYMNRLSHNPDFTDIVIREIGKPDFRVTMADFERKPESPKAAKNFPFDDEIPF